MFNFLEDRKMKKVVLMLMLVGLLGVQVQADLDLTGGNLYADASESNTSFVDGTNPFSNTGTVQGLWRDRGSFGYNAAGEHLGTGANIMQAMVSGWGSTGVVQDLKTTVTGLVEGAEYKVYVVYATKSTTENWYTVGSLVPFTKDVDGTKTNGIAYGFAAATDVITGSTTGATIDILEGLTIDSSTYSGMMGYLGNVIGDASGLLDVYAGYGTDLADNERAWYDGVYLQAVPEPATLAILGLGALLIRRKR
jgi:hypothetical protein